VYKIVRLGRGLTPELAVKTINATLGKRPGLKLTRLDELGSLAVKADDRETLEDVMVLLEVLQTP
jgi:hypothetical protein